MADATTGRQLYIDMLRRTLTNLIYQDQTLTHYTLTDPSFDMNARLEGFDMPTVAHTMVGMKRLDNVRICLEQVLAEGISGDFIETGVWRGGVCIFARGILKAYGITDRRVWLADSFEGLPVADESSEPLDQQMQLHTLNHFLGVPMNTVQENFRRYDLLDDQVRFLPGWFCDTLPTAPVDKLAVLRLDGDLYESTMVSLTNLYPKVSVGGFVIIDDYLLPACKKAVHEFRDEFGIDDELVPIDQVGVYWRRTS